ncbi:alanine--tRNA ligase [bacterium]|nr:alanine--tRNA ligase [candidate division CSSED10-310 bacterium]
MTSEEIRAQYIQYFEANGHKMIRGCPLIIPSDPSLLFTNAGMNQFKPYFLGLEKPQHRRAVNSQRCMRVSGKHNDLDEVGFSSYHHTLFEMLGNWSFGDYYKSEAIRWAWDLLTNVWLLPKSKLFATVFRDDQNEIPEDDEAAGLWAANTDIPKDHILYFGRKDNFWEMGDTGPCGPCTEIHIDRGAEFCNLTDDPSHRCHVNGDCQRYIEIWNLVFIQYLRESADIISPLPEKHVDTGMGLERIVAIMQNARSNYDTDLFQPILERIQELSGHDAETRKQYTVPYRVIADHSRAAAFLITDGIMPSNEWRGYVLRRIIRRAVRFGTKMGLNEPFLHRVAGAVIDKMGPVYTELYDSRQLVDHIIKLEEERFFKTLRQGLPLVYELIEKTKLASEYMLSGEAVFKLYDTYGFPVDITQEIAAEEGLDVDESGFRSAMEDQKTRARAAWKTSDANLLTGIYAEIAREMNPTIFTGYTLTTDRVSIEKIIQNGRSLSVLDNGQPAELIINPTPFYAESGGQIGDTGHIKTETGYFEVQNSYRLTANISILKGILSSGTLKIHDSSEAVVNYAKRTATARNHTATHLLHSALRRTLGDHVKQSGSLVAPDYLRFDFTHFEAVQKKDLEQIEMLVNQAVLSNISLLTTEMDLDRALDRGVMALFGEKYSDTVRVVEIEGVSAELCGGTHVRSTGEIGLFKILTESSIAAGIRRIEAITGMTALSWTQTQTRLIDDIAFVLKSSRDDLLHKLERTLQDNKRISKELENLTAKLAKQNMETSLSGTQNVNGVNLLVHQVNNIDITQLRELADQLKQKIGSGIVLLGSVLNEKAHLVLTVTADLTAKFPAGQLIRPIAKEIDGGGGGRPDMAQAGGSKPEKLTEALAMFPELVRNWDSKSGGKLYG